MTRNTTQFTDASVDDYLASRGNAQQQADCRVLIAMLRAITGNGPRMWGPSIVGHGVARYTHASGRSGDMPLAAFAIRGRNLVLYLDCDTPPQQALLARLGKHTSGKSCLYVRQLSDVDLSVLEQLVMHAVDAARTRNT